MLYESYRCWLKRDLHSKRVLEGQEYGGFEPQVEFAFFQVVLSQGYSWEYEEAHCHMGISPSDVIWRQHLLTLIAFWRITLTVENPVEFCISIFILLPWNPANVPPGGLLSGKVVQVWIKPVNLRQLSSKWAPAMHCPCDCVLSACSQIWGVRQPFNWSSSSPNSVFFPIKEQDWSNYFKSCCLLLLVK